YCEPKNKVLLGFVEGLNNKIRVFQRRAYGYVMRNTSDSKYSAACCQKFNELSLLTKPGQRRDVEVQRQSAKHLMGDRTPLEPMPVKSNAAGGGGLKGQTLQA